MQTKDALGKLSGLISWADGRPVVDPKFTLHRWNQNANRWNPAEKTAEVNGEGTFTVPDLPGGGYWCVVVRVPEAGLALRQINVEAGKEAKIYVTLRPAIASYITVRDERGNPLAGAKFRYWELIDGSEGEFPLIRGSEAGLGLPVPVSDNEGRLALPEFSEGATLKRAQIDHPSHAPAIVMCEETLQAGEVAECALPTGFPVRFQFVQPESAAPPEGLSEVRVSLYGNRMSRDANSTGRIPFPLHNGRMEFQMLPGEFNLLKVEAESHFITPQVAMKTGEKLRIAAGQQDQWILRALPKVLVRGRVVRPDGTPVVQGDLKGEIENLLADGSPPPQEWYAWSFADRGKIDERGEYHLQLAPGRGQVSFEGKGMPAVARTPVTVTGTAEQRVPDIVIRDIPKVQGIVLGIDGKPAAGAIVRLFSKSIRGMILPILADEKGRFEFSFPWMPTDGETQELIYEHNVFAYLPHESVGGVSKVDLRDEEGAGNISIHMMEQPIDWPLSDMRVAFSRRELGEPDEEFRRERMTPENVTGSRVPELDGVLWLNTDKNRLADFRGQFVFLDFYTTWCGPCAYDFPTVKLVHDLYRERGVTVIGVHDNSSAHEAIRKHAAQKGMEMPIVIDHEDGRILKAYEALRLVAGYPSYVVLDPQGRLHSSDTCSLGPTQRAYKLEVIRQLLLEHR